jgi:poly-gamma-glutamate capsule biosynthesis protein CapA/YwtB (metallophosphatase superfamily)
MSDPLYASASGSIRMALMGDIMLSRRLTPYTEPDYVALVQRIRSCDLAFANLETVVREKHEGAPNFTQGTPMTTNPTLLADLAWLGLDLVACANNHVTDYGVEGVRACIRHLRLAGLPFAGIGENLAEARSPAYADTPAGRVGMTAVTSFFRPWNRAADQRPDAGGRPGVSPLGFSRHYTVDAETFAALSTASDKLGLTQERLRQRGHFYSAQEAPSDEAGRLNFLGEQFTRGSTFALSTVVDPGDAAETLRWIREAKRQADWVIFSFHVHEFGSAGGREARNDAELDAPADFAIDFARAAIEAGADVVAGHGHHLTLGIEIHKGCPIFYSLGNFIFQNDSVTTFPAEAYQRFGLDHSATPTDFLDARTDGEKRGFPVLRDYWESVLAECTFEGGALAAVTLHPLDLGFGRPRGQRGRPMPARGDVARHVLDRVARLSRQFGTRIDVEDGQAMIRLTA